MKIDSYIKKIIESTGLQRKEIQELVEEKKKELKGLISDDGALFIIAKELGVDVKEETKKYLEEINLEIADINPNMKNIILIGRIKEIYDIFSFKRDDGSEGRVGSFLLHDNSGDIRIVLWDDNVDILSNNNFLKNELVKVVNGYAKKGRYNENEIHIGKMGKIILSPEDVDYNDYPKIKDELISIKDINLSMKSINIEGKVIQKSPINEFIRKNGETGKVSSLSVMDSTGTSRITFWNDDTEKLGRLKVGEFVLISNLNPKLSSLDSETIDLHISRNSNIIIKDKDIKIEAEFVQKIKNLQNKRGLVSFEGIISSIDDLREISLKSSDNTFLLSFVVSDDSDAIRATLWGDKAKEFSEKLKVGKGILLNNVFLKLSRFSGRNEVSLLEESKLELSDLEIKNLKTIDTRKKEIDSNFTGNYTKINTIKGTSNIEIKGFIAQELNNITIYEACPICYKKIENCLCDNRDKTENRMIFNLIIDDGSGKIRTTFIGDIAEKFIGEETEKILQIKETPDFENFLENKSSEFIGQNIIIKGRAKFSDYSNSYELIAYDFKEVNVQEELEKTVKELEI